MFPAVLFIGKKFVEVGKGGGKTGEKEEEERTSKKRSFDDSAPVTFPKDQKRKRRKKAEAPKAGEARFLMGEAPTPSSRAERAAKRATPRLSFKFGGKGGKRQERLVAGCSEQGEPM